MRSSSKKNRRLLIYGLHPPARSQEAGGLDTTKIYTMARMI
ncbi:hypothetical protein C4K22_3613 [Pseudomonas chlororaphis subsp. aurantiaca]|nr:hypothetical protein C4K24_3447 [Pseudomonas chlororaphis subsp. aurantiaca]AZD36355.1 hypothetical protein C4K22_3613 [Pseudomonas chlororaphis subsp. aurantiaca]AZD42694.1 hypothetical protein C4K21_3621 [Pseudomonas chlororaphis subsp. aurantiaca]